MYLNTVTAGGATHFPRLNLTIAPVAGTAVVFFPCTTGERVPPSSALAAAAATPPPLLLPPDGYLDTQALHAALDAVEEKWVSQVWVRETTFC
jgi:hypothetical protein